MLVVQQDAPLEVLHRVLVVTDFEVGQAKVVVQLRIIILNLFRLFERRDSQNVLLLLVHGDTVVKESLPRARMVLLQMPLALNRQAIPIILFKEIQADLLERHLLLQVPLLFTRCLIVIVIFFGLVFIAIAIIVVISPRRHI